MPFHLEISDPKPIKGDSRTIDGLVFEIRLLRKVNSCKSSFHKIVKHRKLTIFMFFYISIFITIPIVLISLFPEIRSIFQRNGYVGVNYCMAFLGTSALGIKKLSHTNSEAPAFICIGATMLLVMGIIFSLAEYFETIGLINKADPQNYIPLIRNGFFVATTALAGNTLFAGLTKSSKSEQDGGEEF